MTSPVSSLFHPQEQYSRDDFRNHRCALHQTASRIRHDLHLGLGLFKSEITRGRESAGRVQKAYQTEAGSETEIHRLFQAVVGCPFEALGTMAESGSPDAARYCSQLASLSLPYVLAMEITFQVRPPFYI